MLHWNVRKQNRGFTLIEMLVTAILVGVVAAIAAPNFFRMLSHYQVEEGMRQIEGAIKEAQRQAIRNGRACKIKLLTSTTVVPGETRAVVQVVTNEDDGTATTDYSGCLLNERILPSNVATSDDIDGNTNGDHPTEITFSSKGNTDNDSQGIVVISHNGTDTERCVQIEGLLGNIITGDYDGATCS